MKRQLSKTTGGTQLRSGRDRRGRSYSAPEHAYHRDERVRKLRVIPSSLKSERNNKKAVLCVYALSQARRDLVLDAVDDLLE